MFAFKPLTTAWGRWWRRRPIAAQNTGENLQYFELASDNGINSVEEDQHLDPVMKERIQELAQAIHQSLSGSDSIVRAMGRIKSQGRDVFVVLEATIGFSALAEDAAAPPDDDAGPLAEPEFSPTEHDLRLLGSMHIKVGD